jgi:curved DNA-binding protein CbpA
MTGPFAALGLPASPDVTDDEMRAAWRRIAAATHPDRPDGGDPAAFAAAAVAYTLLRTPAGRGEALADHAEPEPSAGRARLAARVSAGRPARLTGRLLASATACTLAVISVGWQPAAFAVITAALTWLAVTGRADLAPPRPPR